MDKFYVMRSATQWGKDGTFPIPQLVAGPLILDQATIAMNRLDEAEGRATDGGTVPWRYSLVGAMK